MVQAFIQGKQQLVADHYYLYVELCLNLTGASNFAEFDPADSGNNDWVDDDEWEKNWDEQVSGTTKPTTTSVPTTKTTTAKQPATASKKPADDFEAYNPLSNVKAKPKSNDDDLWDLLNN